MTRRIVSRSLGLGRPARVGRAWPRGGRSNNRRARSAVSEFAAGFVLVLAGVELLLAWLDAPAALRLSAGGLYLAMLVLLFGYRERWPNPLGWGNRVTLLRAVIVALLAGLAAFPAFLADQIHIFIGLALVSLVLDGVDGWVARRTNSASAFGARFDMELDAFFLLVLCGVLVAIDKVGLWVLWIGLARYLFVFSQCVFARLQRPLRASLFRKIVCVWQGATLLVCLLPTVGAETASRALAVALALLILSFARDVVWLLSPTRTRQAGKSSRAAVPVIRRQA